MQSKQLGLVMLFEVSSGKFQANQDFKAGKKMQHFTSIVIPEIRKALGRGTIEIVNDGQKESLSLSSTFILV